MWCWLFAVLITLEMLEVLEELEKQEGPELPSGMRVACGPPGLAIIPLQ